jgi:hypothetical protein
MTFNLGLFLLMLGKSENPLRESFYCRPNEAEAGKFNLLMSFCYKINSDIDCRVFCLYSTKSCLIIIFYPQTQGIFINNKKSPTHC